MNKVFRLHTGNDGEDWFESQAYGQSEIDKIKDPNGETAKLEITSIPSPFARIALVAEAFEKVAKSNDLDGNTIYHKMVSDALDLGEILFNFNLFKNRIRIIDWDSDSDLDSLISSRNPKHKLYGKTLKTYLDQDTQSYNFDLQKKYFIILFDNKPIGGTSPISLFFTSANDLSFTNINLNNDTLFDDDYLALYKRDPEYQEYLYCIRKFLPEFSEKFRGLDEYLLKNFNKNKTDFQNRIHELNEDEFNEKYEDISVQVAGQPINVANFYLKKRKDDYSISIESTSDFRISSVKYKGNNPDKRLPLVLQSKYGYKLTYVADTWDPNQTVPYYDETPLYERTLPGQAYKYPYLTINDFLEPVILELPYPVNSEKYFNGNIHGTQSGDKAYLIPIKKAYFDYFDTSYLLGNLNGNQVFELEHCGNFIKASLRIPIQHNRYITFEKKYIISKKQGDALSYEDLNKKDDGIVQELKVGLTVLPFCKLKDTNNNYWIQFIDSRPNEANINEIGLQFFKNIDNEPIKELDSRIRCNRTVGDTISVYYRLKEAFDYIHVNNMQFKAVIIPNIPEFTQGNKKFHFAIDFGTTNTHIEFSCDESDPSPFEINKEDLQYATLFSPDAEAKVRSKSPAIMLLTYQELFPPLIGKLHETFFPLRSALCSNKKMDYGLRLNAFSDMNIPFFYEKENPAGHMEVITDLKWSDYTSDDDKNSLKQIEIFFENLLLMIRNKVILNNGNLSKTKITWFYPMSMKQHRIDILESVIKNKFQEIISNNAGENLIKISESLAPFYFFKEKQRISSASKPVVSIDIGGKTCDIVLFKSNKPNKLSSFKFGANTLFGDGLREYPSSDEHGLIKKYRSYFIDKLKKNVGSLSPIYEVIEKSKRSGDIISFYYSLKNNKTVKEKGLVDELNFDALLSQDEDYKILFILYYSAIIYHIALWMKNLGEEKPRFITFSGNGSKVLDIITPDRKKIEALSQQIFERIYDSKYDDEGLEIIRDDEPKKVTSKGGLMSRNIQGYIPEGLNSIFLAGSIPISNKIRYSELNDNIYNQIVDDARRFLKIFFELYDDYDFPSMFGVKPTVELYESETKKDIKSYLLEGISKKRMEISKGDDPYLEETLFFYPIIGMIGNLLRAIP